MRVGKGNVFSNMPIIGDFGKRKRKVSLYANLRDGSIRDALSYGDIEVFRAQCCQPQAVAGHVRALAGKGDMQVLLSSEYAAIRSLMSKDPEGTIGQLREASKDSDESREIVKKILRRLSHSQDEVIRTFAFNEL